MLRTYATRHYKSREVFYVHFCTVPPGTSCRLRRDVFRVQGRGRVLEELLILVVEDEADVQALIDDALCEAGYQPSLVGSGEEALTLWKGGKYKFRALVVDINLKGRTDGWEVARVARETDPTFPIIYMSGAAADEWPSRGVPNSILLTKPFAPAQLVTAISNLLNAGGPPVATND